MYEIIQYKLNKIYNDKLEVIGYVITLPDNIFNITIDSIFDILKSSNLAFRINDSYRRAKEAKLKLDILYGGGLEEGSHGIISDIEDNINNLYKDIEVQFGILYTKHSIQTYCILVSTSANEIFLEHSKLDSMIGLFNHNSNNDIIDLSNADIDTVDSFYLAFADCGSRGVYLGKHELNNLKTMHCAFSGSADMVHVDISGLIAPNADNMQEAFHGCVSLEDIQLFNTEHINNFKSTFERCRSIQSIEMDISSAETLYSTFHGCVSLGAVKLTGHGHLRKMLMTFFNNTKLKDVSIEAIDLLDNADISGSFEYCESLVDLDLSGIHGNSIGTAVEAFANCKALRSLDIGSLYFTEDTDISDIFDGCQSLEHIYVNQQTYDIFSKSLKALNSKMEVI